MRCLPRLTGHLAAIFLILGTPQSAQAVNPTEMLGNALLEKRARHISKDIRCVVCQNQSIDDSDAPLARDLRVLIRQRLLEGDSDQEVISYLVSRYGDFVLLNPPVKGATLFLWFGPVVFALLGLLGLVLYFRRQQAQMKRGVTPS
ncbi:MAG: cytochrome c-type biogenesis protein CcmH [Rhodospirillales bacterium]|nr:cytochrome c-type biogenesis protein CcmH [Rhodospirillales bacterium]